MSDYASSLPIRTQNDGDAVVKIGDGATPSQYLGVDASGRIIVKLDDGFGNLISSQANGTQRALDVGINVAGVQVDPRDIRALTSADSVTVIQGAAAATHASPWWARLTDGTNDISITAAGELKVSVTQPLPIGTNSIGSVVQDNTVQWLTQDLAGGSVTGGAAGTKSLLIGGRYNSTLPTLTTGQQAAIQTDSASRILVGSIFSPLPAGTNLLGGATVYVGAAVASAVNPLPVTITSTIPGTQINKYNTSVNVAANASTNHDYPVTATKTFNGKKFWASGSGRIRADVITSSDGVTFTNVVWTAFNSTAMPNIDIDLDLLTVQDTGAGAIIRMVLTNLDKSPFDVYSTISGIEN